MASLTISASPASAHHPLISATGDCAGNVSWTSDAWEGSGEGQERIDSRTNDDVLISYQVDGGAWQDLENIAYNEANGFSDSGSFQVPEPLSGSVTLRAKVLAPWGNGTAGGQEAFSPPVSFDDCQTPAPEADITVDCDGFVVTLTNTDGTAAADFMVTTPTGATENHTVPAGDIQTHNYPVIEDQTSSVTVTSDGETLDSKEFAADCEEDDAPAPVADIAVDCDEFVVTLTNTEGTAPATFTVTTPDGTTETVTVDEGLTETRIYPVTEAEQTVAVTVTSDGETLDTATSPADCEEPPPTPAAVIDVDCDEFVVTLDNSDGTGPADFLVTTPNGDTEAVEVDAGLTETRTYPVTEDQQTVTVSADGMQDVTATSPPDCEDDNNPAPAATITVNCDGFVVTLDNSNGTAPADFVVTTPNGDTETITVDAGLTETRTLAVIEDATSTVTVTADGMDDVNATFTADCEGGSSSTPNVDIVVDCDGFVLTLDNSNGTAPADFDVTTPTGDTETVSVDAGLTESRTYPVTDGQTSNVSVASAGDVVAAASFSADCAGGSTPPPTDQPPSDQPPGATELNRPPVVLGAEGVRDGLLPSTGAGSPPWLPLVALGLVLTGAALLRRKRSATG